MIGGGITQKKNMEVISFSVQVFTCVCVCVYVLLHRKGKIVEQYQEGFVIVLSSFFCFLNEIGIHYWKSVRYSVQVTSRCVCVLSFGLFVVPW